MRTLFISNVVPWPLEAGDKIRAYHLLRALARVSEVTLVSFAYSEDERTHLEALRPLVRESFLVSRETCGYRRDSRLSAWRLRLKNVIEYGHPTRPVAVSAWESAEAVAMIEGLARGHFDIAWGQWLGSVPYLARMRGARRIVNLNDIEHCKLGHRLLRATFYARMPLECLEYFKLRRFERRLPALGWDLMVCSEADKEVLGGGPRVWVVPNGAELPARPPAPCPVTSSPVLLFVGTMDYAPNVDAVRFFVERIFPRIRQEAPGARFVVVGKNPAPAVQALDDGRAVVVTGGVPDVRPYLEEASLVVTPIRFGGGTRIKILEAMGHRRPVVSTTVGAEGLGVESGKHLLLADDPAEFASACLLLLQNRALGERLAEEAFGLVLERYDWNCIERQVEQIVAARPVAPAPAMKPVLDGGQG